MAPRVVLPPKKNRARCGIKYPLKIVKGDLEPDSEYLDDDLDENSSVMAVADVDINEGNEHHLQAALATKAVFIPTPGVIGVADNYNELYPQNKWKDPISFLKTTQTVEEACSNALVDHEFTYYMDEIDKQWLDKNNQEARGEGTSAQGARSARKGKDKEPEMGVPVSISEDEFELVMGLLEKITEQKVFEGDGPDFSLYQHFFLRPLPADMFASYVTPSWIPPPALLVRIARTIYPHWKQRRSLLDGRRIRPSLNYDESDFLNESYICFRRRDNKPVRKTRAGQVVNHADKLAQLHQNLSQALDIANALLDRENVKQAAAVQSHNVWRARQPMADLLRKFPSLITKADEERLLDRPRKTKPPRTSLPKVKVLPPSNQGTSATAPVGQAIQPSERCAAIQQEILKSMQQESEDVKKHFQVDVVDDPYQPSLIPRAEKMWVDIPPLSPSRGFSSHMDEPVTRSGCRSVRMRYGRGGRRFLDRRSSCHPYLTELRTHRQHVDDDPDEETTRRLQGQWRFDADCSLFGAAEERTASWSTSMIAGPSFSCCFIFTLLTLDSRRYLMSRMAWATKAEASLVTDASLMVPRPDGRQMRIIPEQFIMNALHVQEVYEKPLLSGYLAEEGIVLTSALSPRGSPVPAFVPCSYSRGRRRPAPLPFSRGQRLPAPPPHTHIREHRPRCALLLLLHHRECRKTYPRRSRALSPPHPASMPPRAPPSPVPTPRCRTTLIPSCRARMPTRSRSVARSRAPSMSTSTSTCAAPQSRAADQRRPHGGSRVCPTERGTNMSLKLPSRVARPSPLATHSVVAAQLAGPSPSRTNES
ncbi:polycomb enhancer protein [Mycena leptocephala]|nr:polycomb enhancer protein [Mycena leptocephala]